MESDLVRIYFSFRNGSDIDFLPNTPTVPIVR